MSKTAEASTEKPIHVPIKVTDANFDREVLDSDVPVIADFWAEWCGPCKALAPSLERLAAESEGSIKIVKYNTEMNRKVAEALNIRALPTLVLFRDGEVVDVQMGALPYARLARWVEKRLGPKKPLLKRLFGKA